MPEPRQPNEGETPVIEIRDLEYTFMRRSVKILKGIDFSVYPGQVVAIMGGSGSGKTTVLRNINGQYQSPHGSVIVDHRQVNRLGEADLQELRKKIGMLFQFGGLFTDMSVFDNVAFPLRQHTRLSEQTVHDLVLLKLHSVGLRAAARKYPSEISGGMARRVALARAIALDPKIILYDEPFAGLDPVSLTIIAKLIRQLNEALGASSVIVTHDVAESFDIVDYVYIMWEGRIVSQGTPEEMRRSDVPIVRQFINGDADGPLPFHYPGSSVREDFRLREAGP